MKTLHTSIPTSLFNLFRAATACMLIFLLSLKASAMDDAPKVLMVVSSYGQAENPTQPGYEFEEFAKAYLIFKESGLKVDVASPKGGAAKADEFDASKNHNALVLADENAMSKLENTLPTSNVNAREYSAIFVVGGKGAMFDLPNDTYLQEIIRDIYQANGTVAAVCHGPAALVNVKLGNNQYLIDNKKVNGFTNIEERQFGAEWIDSFDFLLEDKLIERGGIFESSAIMLQHVAVDGRLITGQNPTSTSAVALELVKSLDILPRAITPAKQEQTLAYVKNFISGDDSALVKLKANDENIDIKLAGVWALFFSKSATTNEQREQALKLMEIANQHLNHPKIAQAIEESKLKLQI